MVEDSGETIKMGGGLKSSGLVGRDSEDLEFDEDFKNKVKLREGGMGEPPSLKEIERFLKVKEMLRSLLEDKRKQRGLVYRLGLKKRNSNIDQEIREMGEEYHQLLIGIKVKTGYSDEEVREYIEGGRAKRVENALVRFQEEIEEAKERLGPKKKELYGLLKELAKDKRVRFLMGTALTGTALVTPPSGFVSMLVLGLNPDYLPFDIGSMANGTLKGKSFLLRDVLKERRERQKEGLRTVKVSFTGSEDLTEEEEELRDIRLEKTKEEKKKKAEEKFSQEQLLEEVISKEEEIAPQEIIAEKPEMLAKEEIPLPEVVEEVPVAEEEVPPEEAPVAKEEVLPPEIIEEVPVAEEEVPPVALEEVPVAKEEIPLPEVVEEIQLPAVKEEAVVEALLPEVIEEIQIPPIEEEVPLIVRKPAIGKKEKASRKRKFPEKDLSLAQLQKMEEELLTGKPPEEEKDKKK
ncbi:MAG: hypothetical protein PHO90_02865 [Candidatus Pacebacteria bacterium]|nr:hypothetical protein [Candidatus Paceibacterota bacterium]